MDRYVIDKISQLLKVSIVEISAIEENFTAKDMESNPITADESLRHQLIKRGREQNIPYILKDDFNVYYACVSGQQTCLLLGPMATEKLSLTERHKYFSGHKCKVDEKKAIRQHSLNDVLDATCLIAKLELGAEYTQEELLEANGLTIESDKAVLEDEILYNMKEEESEHYRHSYQDERHLLESVKEGNVEEALKRTREMDGDIGKLSVDDLSHWKNIMVICATLCARAAIEGGVAPYDAYRVSGFYINKGSACSDILQVISYRNKAVEELTGLVQKQKEVKHTSNYTESAKDYVRKHFREKIYLEELADSLGISASYLSRTFKKDTGICLQDYVINVRLEKAANLLIYSGEPIPKIAGYVNFPSQSYFGKLFKEKTGYTPREYRENYKPAEFED